MRHMVLVPHPPPTPSPKKIREILYALCKKTLLCGHPIEFQRALKPRPRISWQSLAGCFTLVTKACIQACTTGESRVSGFRHSVCSKVKLIQEMFLWNMLETQYRARWQGACIGVCAT